MFWLPVRNHRKCARRSAQKGIEHSLVISKNALAVIQSGISKVTVSLCLMAIASSKPLIHTHTQVGKWDLIIAHPPCTYLTCTGNSWFDTEKYGKKAEKRWRDRVESAVFFMRFTAADCDKIAIENPVGIMNTAYRKPDCIVHPYFFGEDAKKKTCFWLKNLPPLIPTNMVEPTTVITGHATDSPWHSESWNLPPAERAKFRSKTFPGVAKAMAEQWG